MLRNESALVMAKSSELRDALEAILTAIPQIKKIYQTDNQATMVKMAALYRPALILLDFDLPANDLLTTLTLIKLYSSWSQSIVLVEDEQQYQIAKAAGADVVLIKGIRAAKLLSLLTERVSAFSVTS